MLQSAMEIGTLIIIVMPVLLGALLLWIRA